MKHRIPQLLGLMGLVCAFNFPVLAQNKQQSITPPDRTQCKDSICTYTSFPGFAGQDALITAASPAANFGTAETMALTSEGAVLIQANLEELPDSVYIVSATLTLQEAPSTKPKGSFALQASTLGAAWDENTVSWSTRPATLSDSAAVGEPGSQEYSFDVTQAVQRWVIDREANHGLEITLAGQGEITFASADFNGNGRHPHLEVVYNRYKQGTPPAPVTANLTREEFQDLIFGQLDFSEVTTGLLTDYSLTKINLDEYNGLGELPDLSAGEWGLLYGLLYYSQVEDSTLVPGLNEVKANLYNYRVADKVPVLVLDYQYNYFDSTALDRGLLTQDEEGVLWDVAGRTESPYLQDRLMGIAPHGSQARSNEDNEVTFIFPPEAFLVNNGTGVTTVEVDFGDGNGFQTIGAGDEVKVAYSNTDSITLTMRTLDAATLQQRGKPGSNAATLAGYRTTSGVIPFYSLPENSLGDQRVDIRLPGNLWAEVTAYLGNECGVKHAQVRKPIVLVEGFDIIDNTEADEYYNKLRIEGGGDPELMQTQLANAGYDVLVVNLRSHLAGIDDNARLIQALIRQLNDMGLDEGIHLIGFSMGGLISKYALRQMEMAGETHNVLTYTSYDSPHQGAYFPASELLFFNSLFVDDPVVGVGAGLANVIDGYDSEPVRQMAVLAPTMANVPTGANTYADLSYADVVSAERISFMMEYQALGMPQQTRGNYAISNGLYDGGTQTRTRGNPIPATEFAKIFEIRRGFFFGSNRRGYAKSHPNQGPTTQVVDYSFFIPGPWFSTGTTINRQYDFENTLGQPYDWASGGYVDINGVLSRGSTILSIFTNFFRLQTVLDINITDNNYPRFSFVPATSALDLPAGGFGASNYYQFNSLYQFAITEDDWARVSPFDDIVTEGRRVDGAENRKHIAAVKPRTASWLFEKITGRPLDVEGSTGRWINLSDFNNDVLYHGDPYNPSQLTVNYYILGEEVDFVERIIDDLTASRRFYVRYNNRFPGVLVLADYCSGLVYGLYEVPFAPEDLSDAELLEKINQFIPYHGEYDDPNFLIQGPFTGADYVSPDNRRISTVLGRFTYPTETVPRNPETQAVIESFGNWTYPHFKPARDQGSFNLLNVNQVTGTVFGQRAIGPEGEKLLNDLTYYPDRVAGDWPFFYNLNLPWLDSAIARRDAFWGITNRHDYTLMYKGNVFDDDRDNDAISIFGLEARWLELKGYRWTTEGRFVKINEQHTTIGQDSIKYQAMDFYIPEKGENVRHEDLRELILNTKYVLGDLASSSCGYTTSDRLAPGEVAYVVADLVNKGYEDNTSQKYTILAYAVDGYDTQVGGDCLTLTLVTNGMVTNKRFDYTSSPSCNVSTALTAEAKLLEFLAAQMEQIEPQEGQWFGRVQLISEKENCLGSQWISNQFRTEFPEVQVLEIDQSECEDPTGFALLETRDTQAFFRMDLPDVYVEYVSYLGGFYPAPSFATYTYYNRFNPPNIVLSGQWNTAEDYIIIGVNGLIPGENYETQAAAMCIRGRQFSNYTQLIPYQTTTTTLARSTTQQQPEGSALPMKLEVEQSADKYDQGYWIQSQTGYLGENGSGKATAAARTETQEQQAITDLEQFNQTIGLLAYPNPATSSTTFRYTLQEAGKVNISLYTVQGALVKVLYQGEQGEGAQEVGADLSGVEPGAYFYSLRLENGMFMQKPLVISR